MKRQRDEDDVGVIDDEEKELVEQEQQYVEKVEKEKETDYEVLLSQNLTTLFEFSETNFITVEPNPFYFKGYLRPFQLDGLSWMLNREMFSRSYENNPIDWVKDSTNPNVFVNKETGVKTFMKPIKEKVASREIPSLPLTPVLGGILADEMGLGKTIQMISVICTNHPKNLSRWATMIVCPAVLLYQWKEEFERNTQNVKVLIQHGKDRKDQKSMQEFCQPKKNQQGNYDLIVVITSYDTLKSDRNKGVYGNIKFLRLCLDEAHEIRNFETGKKFENVNKIDTLYRWALTGTPIQNKYEDFFALLKFLRVSPYGQFNAWYRMIDIPISQPSKGLRMEGLRLLRDITSLLVLRRTKAQKISVIQNQPLKEGTVIELIDKGKESFQVDRLDLENFVVHNLNGSRPIIVPYQTNGQLTYRMKDVLVPLPDKTVSIVYLNFSGPEKKVYDKLEKEAKIEINDGKEINIIKALPYLLRLRQSAVHPLLVNKDAMSLIKKNDRNTWPKYETSTKLSHVLKDIAKKLSKDPTSKFLVFSVFTKVLDLFEIDLRKARWNSCKYANNSENRNVFCRLDGQMTIEERKVAKELFQNDKSVKILLCSLLATSVGLNLTSANNVYFLDLHYNPQIHSQAIDRAHRIGQTRPVKVKFLVMKNSVEENIWKLMEYKDNLASSVLKPVRIGREKVLQMLK